MPSNSLGDAELSGDGLNVVAHHLAQPKRLLATLRPRPVAVGREDPIGRSVIRRVPIPFEQVRSDVFINGNRLMRDLGLALLSSAR